MIVFSPSACSCLLGEEGEGEWSILIAGTLLNNQAGALWVGFASPENDLLKRAEFAVEI